MKKKKPTITDVAKNSGVSVSTVSRVLNKDPNVDNKIKAHVNETITEIGYERIRKHSKNKKSSIGLIGAVIHDVTSPAFGPFIKGIEEMARRNSVNTIICNSQRNPDIEKESIIQLVNKGVDGIILMPLNSDNSSILKYIDNNCPYVLLDRYLYDNKDVPSVYSDNHYGAYMATKYLLDLGHRKILYIDGTVGSSNQRDRLKGFKDSLQDYNLDEDESYIINGGYNWKTTYDNLTDFIKSGKKFSAVFASSDVMAFGARMALEEHELKIPDDISLMGYDGFELSSTISLSTVYHGSFELGKESVTVLLDLIKEKIKPPHSVVLQPSLLIRKTCKKK